MKKLLAIVAVVAGLSGCNSVSYEWKTKDGTQIKAEFHSFFGDTSAKSVKYDHANGTLDVRNFNAKTDSEALKEVASEAKDVATKVGKLAAGAAL